MLAKCVAYPARAADSGYGLEAVRIKALDEVDEDCFSAAWAGGVYCVEYSEHVCSVSVFVAVLFKQRERMSLARSKGR